jgi:putative MFS transporter
MPENTDPPEAVPAPVAARPRWYRMAWFLGKPPPLTERQWQVLGLVSIVSFFEQYDLYLFSLNLSQIQQSLAIADADLGFLGSIVRAGALFAFLVTMFADRIGRRRVLIGTVLAYTLLTAATAFAPNAETFVVLQFLARVFAVAETLLAAVVIVEEFPDEHRGWGIGGFAALQACGAGFAAILYGFVDVLPYGWRALYLVGVLPLLLIARMRMFMPETERFASLAGGSAAAGGAGDAPPAVAAWRASARLLGRLFTEARGRFLVVSATTFCFAFGLAGVGFFQVKYLVDAQGWSPPQVATLTVIGGGLAIVANPLAGRLSDRLGRRLLASGFLAAAGVLAAGFYSVSGAWVSVLWVLYLFAVFGAETAITTYASEVFPTSLRATASGARVVVSTIGGITGLAAVSWLYPWLGGNWAALTWLPVACALAAVLAWFGFRETAGRSLEAIAPERPPAQAG